MRWQCIRLLSRVPTWSGQNVFYGYDLLNRTTAADFGSLGGTGVSYAYDALSRQTGETAGGRTIASQYDLAGDRTQITWPDSFYVDYVYDVLQRPTKVEEEGATSGVGLLATYTYNSLGLLSTITRGNGADTSVGYDGAGRISSLAHSFVNTSANVSWTFTYDAANGVLTRTATNDAYTSHPGALSLSYTPNGLNQYSSVSGATYSYDTRGNLTSDGARTFTYDVDDKLLTGSAPTAATFTYDPLGRMQTDTASATTTTFLYDGDNLSAEYNSSGTVLRRYVPSGLGIDQPLVWYEGAGTTDRRWLHADNQGSIAAYSNASGDETAAYGYSPYGEPAAWSGSRYAYTGQLMIPENGLYNYKARAYDPKLGRFLQTDPIGIAGGVNLYGYVLNDPTNQIDPTGLTATSIPFLKRCDAACMAATVTTGQIVVDAPPVSRGPSIETYSEGVGDLASDPIFYEPNRAPYSAGPTASGLTKHAARKPAPRAIVVPVPQAVVVLAAQNNDCTAYTTYCQQYRDPYDCSVAPFVCKNWTFPPSWTKDVRSCLQSREKAECLKSRNPPTLQCLVNIHEQCWSSYPVLPPPRHP